MSKTSIPHHTIRPRTAAMVAGIGILAMAVIGMLSQFGVMQPMIVLGDAQATAANLVNSEPLFRLGAVGLLLVAILDIIVAWGLYVVFRAVNPSLSLFGAWLRLIYASIFSWMIISLFSALRKAPVDPEETLFLLESFNQGWQAALILFGLHLGVVGFLVWRSDLISRIISVLLIVSALGYVADGFGTLLNANYTLALSNFTFIGEVIFIFWLLLKKTPLPDGLNSDQ